MAKKEQMENDANNIGGDLYGTASESNKQSDAPTDVANDVENEQTEESLLTNLAELKLERDKFVSLAQRARADLINYRRRAEQEQDKARIRERQRMVLRYAEIVDQLKAVVNTDDNQTTGNTNLEAWVVGIRAIYDKFIDLLKSEGFEQFNTVGEQFDPTRHEALGTITVEGGVPGTVANQLRAGCTYKGEVIRPALVQTVTENNASETKTKQHEKEEH